MDWFSFGAGAASQPVYAYRMQERELGAE